MFGSMEIKFNYDCYDICYIYVSKMNCKKIEKGIFLIYLIFVPIRLDMR